MQRTRGVTALLLMTAALFLAPAAAGAQELYTFTIGLLGTLGGSLDSDVGNDLTNPGVQLNLTMVTEPRTHVGFRLGTLEVGEDGVFGNLGNADLSYITIGGEYRVRYRFYDSGFFAGLGGYRLEGTSLATGASQDETGLGLVLGLSGDFQLTRNFSFVVELAGHYADLNVGDTFLTGHAGIAYHF